MKSHTLWVPFLPFQVCIFIGNQGTLPSSYWLSWLSSYWLLVMPLQSRAKQPSLCCSVFEASRALVREQCRGHWRIPLAVGPDRAKKKRKKAVCSLSLGWYLHLLLSSDIRAPCPHTSRSPWVPGLWTQIKDWIIPQTFLFLQLAEGRTSLPL